ncbi:DUF4870 domain-containing protein [Nocardioides mesophilus]|uniref:DUF4870 domain-containing protein n=2 Tax=Nocardioides mesophilus TaxID=433659 RepID=A0A7G9RGQ9_9ACTN|nr:DUF4870 domain-containing protein [Nocardioides mesophilus]
MSPSEERNWALAAHVGSFVAAWFAFGFIAPLIVLLVKGKDSAYVRRHSVESLNFQLSVLIYAAAATLLTLVTLGIAAIVVVPVAIVAAIGYVVVVVLASIRAANGEDYRYPLTLRLVS